MTPFNTGKVQIGLLYQPAMPRIDGHMMRLQTALIDKRTSEPLVGWQRVFGFFWRFL